MSNIIHTKHYRNWTRGALGLHYVQNGLYPFTDRVVKYNHARIIQNLKPCTSCTVRNIQPAHTKGTVCIHKSKTKCNCRRKYNKPCDTCGQLYDIMIIEHRFRDPLLVTDASTWYTDHWQIAKCFMTTTTQSSNNTAAETDVGELLSIIINCIWFQTELQCYIDPPHDMYSKVRHIRNTILHNSGFELSDTGVTAYLYDMIAVLEDQKALIYDPSAQVAVKKLKEILNDEFVITTKEEARARQTAQDDHEKALDMTTPESVVEDGSSLHKMAFDGRLLKLEKNVICDLEKNCTLYVGSGSFGEVYASTSVLKGFDLRVAVKKIRHSNAADKSIRREKNASRIMHPFILPLLAVKDRPNGKNEVWFVSPYCENGDLNAALKIDHDASSRKSVKMNNVRRVKILLQIALAIEYIHTTVKGVRDAILHKDIASKNVVLDAHYNARLIDFGLAREKDDETTILAGRFPYLKPSIFEAGQAHATESWDYYAYGVVIREMLTGIRPEGEEGTYLGRMEAQKILTKLQKYVWPEEATAKERKLDSIAQECLQAERWNASVFKTEVVKNLNDILTQYNGNILDIPEDYKRCHICMMNQQATESSMTQEHGNKCRIKIKVCVACEKNSFVNPITCYCGAEVKPDIGYRWGALLVAGNDENDTKLAAAFTKDMQEMNQLITSRAPLIMGIPKDKVRIVVPENPGSPRGGTEPTIVSKVEEALLYFSEETEVDTLLIYFSCHGKKKDEYGNNRFQFGSASDCMSHDEFEKKLEEMRNIRRLIIFLDCCYPPLIKHRKCEKFIQINACESHERARSRDDNGMFTKYLIQGLKAKSEGKKCPDNCEHCKAYWEKGSDFISLQSLFDYVNNHLKGKAPTPDWQGRSWKNIAFYSDEIVEIEFTSIKDGKTKSVPLGYLLNMDQIKENLRQQFGKDGATVVSISRDTFRKDKQFQNCDTLEKVMLAWVQRLPLHVTFEESTNQS